MTTKIYDHRSGLNVVPNDFVENIKVILNEADSLVFDKSFKNHIRDKLRLDGWTGEYRLDIYSRITITSYKNEIGLCFQTGNVGRIYADLLKLQTLFTKGKIKAGMILLPTISKAKQFGTNTANYERLVRELPIFSQVITMPIVVVGFNGTEEE